MRTVQCFLLILDEPGPVTETQLSGTGQHGQGMLFFPLNASLFCEHRVDVTYHSFCFFCPKDAFTVAL